MAQDQQDQPSGGPVPTYTVSVRLNRSPNDDELRTLRQHDHNGGVHVDRNHNPKRMRLTREAESLPVAVADTIDAVAAIPDLQVYWVETDTYTRRWSPELTAH